MGAGRGYDAGLVVAGDADFKGDAAVAGQGNDGSIIHDADAMRNALSAQFFDGLADVLGGPPLASVNGSVQTGLTSFAENSVKRSGRELGLVAGQINADNAGAHAFGGEPGDLLRRVRGSHGD